MEITWYGLSCFRLNERKHASVITDPYNGKLGLPALKVKGDVVTISHDAPGHNYATAVNGVQHNLDGLENMKLATSSSRALSPKAPPAPITTSFSSSIMTALKSRIWAIWTKCLPKQKLRRWKR